MTAVFERHIHLDGAYNVRDLGGYASASGQTHWRRVLRADGLHRVSQAGLDMLVETGVRLVIDLRHDHEIAAAPNPFVADGRVRYLNVPLFSGLVPQASEKKTGGILLDLYLQALSSRGEAIRMVVETIAHAGEGGVLFHCTAGKDRTGIIAALLLAAAGVPRETILADYALTGERITPLIDELVADAIQRGLDAGEFKKLLGSEPGIMAAALDHLDGQYGGAAGYLAHIGLSKECLGKLQMRLLVSGKETV
ncbi:MULTISPECIES: tyrosine-protein phosphatase [Rhizobium/Agrobacterium group]|uniref:tyrosine-protein phosphatase n=1 Tax=Rhizobium/Agrobacterium group TaxID=227290 RepID=UPI000BD7B574|nr:MULTISPECIES: tyrosine-protein phosphatase [Rhizobium/Agrobacterium group]MDH7808712.1 protein-tyrosine phosphatase [Rhizobium sp. AN67]MDQ4409251.1 tyrosine-protein phosphatase [Rhizobium sp. AN63]MQB04801.1 tyrosine-protein phosphatase [Agrobacterium tumefaciens]SOD50835.1 protein-tyrosine phosphatase [Rhizobium sp. AN6A]